MQYVYICSIYRYVCMYLFLFMHSLDFIHACSGMSLHLASRNPELGFAPCLGHADCCLAGAAPEPNKLRPEPYCWLAGNEGIGAPCLPFQGFYRVPHSDKTVDEVGP